jgi:hypothetical protein
MRASSHSTHAESVFESHTAVCGRVNFPSVGLAASGFAFVADVHAAIDTTAKSIACGMNLTGDRDTVLTS